MTGYISKSKWFNQSDITRKTRNFNKRVTEQNFYLCSAQEIVQIYYMIYSTAVSVEIRK